MSQMTANTPLRVEYARHPRDAVQIRQGVPLTVPSGYAFVPTAIGVDVASSVANFNEVIMLVDGTEQLTTTTALNSVAARCSFARVPLGFCVTSGSVVSVLTNEPDGDACLLGYLERVVASPDGRRPLRVEFLPRPEESVVIREGSPLAVPPGKCLMITALGGTRGHDVQAPQRYGLLIGGQIRVTAIAPSTYLVPPIAELPPGLVVQAGVLVEPRQLDGAASQAQAWGYLISTSGM